MNPNDLPNADGTTGGQNFVTVPKGVYQDAVCVEIGLGKAGSDEKPQVGAMFEISQGEHKGSRVPWYGYFTEKTEKGTIAALNQLGWDGDFLNLESCVGGKAPITVQEERDLEGNLRSKVRWVGGGGLVMKNVMSDEEKRQFALGIQARLGIGAKKGDTKKDDIPF